MIAQGPEWREIVRDGNPSEEYCLLLFGVMHAALCSLGLSEFPQWRHHPLSWPRDVRVRQDRVIIANTILGHYAFAFAPQLASAPHVLLQPHLLFARPRSYCNHTREP
jgi:hypothetical protein